MRPNAHALEEGNVELGVDATVLISPHFGDTALALQYAEVLGANPEPPRYFAYVEDNAVHADHYRCRRGSVVR